MKNNNKRQSNCSKQNAMQHNTMGGADNGKECDQCNNRTLQYLAIIVPVAMVFIQFIFSLYTKNVEVSNLRDTYFAEKRITALETTLSLVMGVDKAENKQELKMAFDKLDTYYLSRLRLYGEGSEYLYVSKLLNFVRDYLDRIDVEQKLKPKVPDAANGKNIDKETKEKIRSLAAEVSRSTKKAIHTT